VWVAAAIIAVYSAVQGYSLLHTVADMGAVAAGGIVATR